MIGTVNIQEWEDILTHTGCICDLQNLERSGEFIIRSLTKKFSEDVTSAIGMNPGGPRVLQEIISIEQQLDSSGMRALENILQAFQLKDEPAENVAECIKKITPVTKSLMNCVNSQGDPKTGDVSATVAKGFTKCSVESFRMEAMLFHTACNRDSNAMRWDEITTQLLASCHSLLGQKGEWPPAELPNKSVEQMHLAALTAEMNQLKSKMTTLTSPNNSETKCCDCGKKGVKRAMMGALAQAATATETEEGMRDTPTPNSHILPRKETPMRSPSRVQIGFTARNAKVDGGSGKTQTKSTQPKTMALELWQPSACNSTCLL